MASGQIDSAQIDEKAIAWTVDGIPANAETALTALATKPLLVLLHGYGSFEGDLIGLAPSLPHGFVCASPRAIEVAPPPIENGYAWWPLVITETGAAALEPDPTDFVGSAPHKAAVAVLAWLDLMDARVRDTNNTGLGEIAVLGFSQGGCIVTSLLRLRPERFSCGVNCSGFVAPGHFAGDAALAAIHPPMFWGSDPADPIISTERTTALEAWATKHTALEKQLYHGVFHGISAAEVEDISEFLLRHTEVSA